MEYRRLAQSSLKRRALPLDSAVRQLKNPETRAAIPGASRTEAVAAA